MGLTSKGKNVLAMACVIAKKIWRYKTFLTADWVAQYLMDPYRCSLKQQILFFDSITSYVIGFVELMRSLNALKVYNQNNQNIA